jgi:hypothetical protein
MHREPSVANRLVLPTVSQPGIEAARLVDPGQRGDPKGVFAGLEARLPGLDEGKRRLFLRDLATAAFDAGETTKATRFSNELVSPSSATQDWARGNEIHVGHLLLARLALGAGDVAGGQRSISGGDGGSHTKGDRRTRF